MRLHTDHLTKVQLCETLAQCQVAGLVGNEVTFTDYVTVHNSRTHDRAFEVKLGYFDRVEGRTNRRQNRRGDNVPFAATYEEWGHFMAALFELDPAACWGSAKYGYNGVADFHEKTKHRFHVEVMA